MLAKIRKMILHAKTQLLVLVGMFTFCILPNNAQAVKFSEITQLVFFGDSLSDSGFNNTFTLINGTPDKAPTFTTFNGYTWSQYVAHDILGVPLLPPGTLFPSLNDKITNNTTPLYIDPSRPPPPTPVLLPKGFNYACGGARVVAEPGVNFYWAPSIARQVQNYLATAPKKLDPKAMFFIWGGANDMLSGIASQLNPIAFMQLIDQTTTQIVQQVEALSARGAKRIVVLSLPNIGVTPFITRLAGTIGNPSLPADIKNLSFMFDSLLNQKLGAVMKRYKHHDVKILYFDTYMALDNLISNALAGRPTVVNGISFLFKNVTDPVCTAPLAILCQQTSNNYLFADSVHPTDMAHRALSLEIENKIKLWA
ncbi:SGNH/GDSL hydrolase family protein [Fluoribacter dumoffii]|uniref:SGNH/GDSL hydrolase family protein n=1 Tax=Fluoribacter dumoffii TaxID=463 RepID=UPI00026C7A69|nr:SGNH/GDSL hydrolase family protein [Fluoribacter dumoffii]MCW8386237.1 SGNH/GDSL hydrolase family protein [Fluoribacter dumoffii]MCW8419288.1 SGNH/GDSL hydrolase family protein [Fluoribacter dumoffii]MCW8452837.1 SGNH/GDSL hydrolase family protein [Fluoribacter dumoffii]MCW8459913.1 SGNH/GDSL hydrolase family protein [Fluoribacter dumoffii]MCW8483391.1 SGNH/GDSL hydrolase family protein [Fluoribacter dumoffii]